MIPRTFDVYIELHRGLPFGGTQGKRSIVTLPYYLVFRDGQRVVKNPSDFSLHDTHEQFERSPRVFTTFVARSAQAGTDQNMPGMNVDVVGLSRHFARLQRDAAHFGLEFDPLEVRTLCMDAIRQTPVSVLADSGARVRLAVGDLSIEAYVDTYIPPRDSTPLAACSVLGKRAYCGQKTTSTAVSRAAMNHANSLGMMEALLLDESNYVLEASWSNFFWFERDGSLHTPEGGILPGVTRELILEALPCKRSRLTVPEILERATECFLTQSTTGVRRLHSIDGIEIRSGSPSRCFEIKELVAGCTERLVL